MLKGLLADVNVTVRFAISGPRVANGTWTWPS
jgi:hypothetical protein